MKVGICVLAACLLAASAAANAKIVHRWSPEALAQGKFVAEKTAFVRKEVKQGGGCRSRINIFSSKLTTQANSSKSPIWLPRNKSGINGGLFRVKARKYRSRNQRPMRAGYANNQSPSAFPIGETKRPASDNRKRAL